MSYADDVTRCALEAFRRVEGGAVLTTQLAREVIRDLGTTVTPTTVLFEAQGFCYESAQTRARGV